MLIGGVAALLFQTLHPLTMAGVARYSNYRQDPLGRLERTASFLTATTFGAHRGGSGGGPGATGARRRHRDRSGRPSLCGRRSGPAHLGPRRRDPCFLTSATHLRPTTVRSAEQDPYVDEMARVAIALGATDVPRSVSELDRYFAAVRPELASPGRPRTARNFVLRGVGRWPHEVTTYGLSGGRRPGGVSPRGHDDSCAYQRPAGDRWPRSAAGPGPALHGGETATLVGLAHG